jgi:hypothetical protein
MTTLTPRQILEHIYSVQLRPEHSSAHHGVWHKIEMSEEAKEWLSNIDETDYIVVRRDEQPEVLFKDEIRATQFKLAFG